MSELSEGQRVLSRARSLTENGKARSWSHAIALAADTLKKDQTTTTDAGPRCAAPQTR